MENQEKAPFNKFAKISIWTAVGSVIFLVTTMYTVESNFFWDTLWDIDFLFFTKQPWGNLYLTDIIFSIFLYGSMTLLCLTPIFGSIASYQAHKRKERGDVVALLITGVSILYIIFQILTWV